MSTVNRDTTMDAPAPMNRALIPSSASARNTRAAIPCVCPIPSPTKPTREA